MTTPSPPRLFQLSGSCNHYDWGQKGRQSLAARLCERTPGTDFVMDDDEFYSEIWFGDYLDYPAKVLSTGDTLRELIGKKKEKLLGPEVNERFGSQLPFLPKILSIAKALPLQIHPNKSLAVKLNKQSPEKFTDTNHKPEIAIALSRFELFVGWKPYQQMSDLFSTSALKGFVPTGTTQWDDKTVKHVVRSILKCDEATVLRVADDLIGSAQSQDNRAGRDRYVELLPRLQSQYSSGDPGTLVAVLCMNFLVLEPGEAIFIPADGIHAYLSGDIMECMARSNNMLSVGLAPAADRDDADLFTNTMTFSTQSDNIRLFPTPAPDGAQGHTSLFKTPAGEFDILRLDLQSKEEELIWAHKGPAVAIVVCGEGTVLGSGQELAAKEGYVFFIAADTATMWKADSKLQVYTAVYR